MADGYDVTVTQGAPALDTGACYKYSELAAFVDDVGGGGGEIRGLTSRRYDAAALNFGMNARDTAARVNDEAQVQTVYDTKTTEKIERKCFHSCTHSTQVRAFCYQC